MNVSQIKKDFPIFKKYPNLVYLDSASTSLKPKQVVAKLVEYYQEYPANIKRGIYKISEKATEEYEKSREAIAKFINAKTDEVIFTRGTTESVNLIAYALGREIVDRGDEVIVTIQDHHSNFVPWQQLAFEVGADFKVINIDSQGYLDLGKNLKDLDRVITKRTKILTLPYVSNVLGTINPIREITRAAKKINPKIIIVVDAAQAVPHMQVDVRELNCDFLAFSGHKMLGPTGIGVLWGKRELLQDMFPFQYGGEMIREVKIEKTIFLDPPDKFEAGTPPIAEAIALKSAIEYLEDIGMSSIRKHEEQLIAFSLKKLQEEFGNQIKIYGPRKIQSRGGVVSFSINGIHPHDMATILDEDNIAIRAGHHCTMPLHQALGIVASLRASFYLYNSKEDIEKIILSLKKATKLFKK